MNTRFTLKFKKIVSLALLCICFGPSISNAAVVQYLTRAAWLADTVGQTKLTEDFEPFPGGTNNNTSGFANLAPTFISAHGFMFSEVGSTIQLLTGGNPTNSSPQYVIFRDLNFTTLDMQIAFPIGTTAFGFDYSANPNDPYSLLNIPGFGNAAIPSGNNFIGFTGLSSIQGITLSANTNFGSGLFIDNITLVVPEPVTPALAVTGLVALGLVRRKMAPISNKAVNPP